VLSRFDALDHRFVVIDVRKGVVEVMQELSPLLVLRGFPEAFLVCGDAVPAHQQKILALAFETTLKLV
jgi:hypothetical protein